jgi:hypothetical protein
VSKSNTDKLGSFFLELGIGQTFELGIQTTFWKNMESHGDQPTRSFGDELIGATVVTPW